MRSVQIVLIAVAAAALYGVIHDQITARICVEYFTIGHPPVFKTSSPTLLGLGWGVYATWWVGAILGGMLAVAARAGRDPKRMTRTMIKPVAILIAVMAVGATVAAVVGHALATRGVVVLHEQMASQVPADRHVAFITALWAHSASYTIAFVGGTLMVLMVWVSRRIETLNSSTPRSDSRTG
jgi:hypothetical protein